VIEYQSQRAGIAACWNDFTRIGWSSMTDEITREIFDHMVRLAALELGEEESEYLRRELNHQLKAIHELEAIPLSEAAPLTSHGIPYTPDISPSIRDDEWIPFPQPDKILDQAPEVEDRYIVVPEIRHTDLE
jgi:aspartyl-tRNA(Asn)/glutamyl-tRNA(Gln) amidotransferase subunit C